jgi:hypothetical protein
MDSPPKSRPPTAVEGMDFVDLMKLYELPADGEIFYINGM